MNDIVHFNFVYTKEFMSDEKLKLSVKENIGEYTLDEMTDKIKELTTIKHQYDKRKEGFETKQSELCDAIIHYKKRKGRSPIDRYCDTFKDVTMAISNIEDFITFCDEQIKKMMEYLRKKYL